MVKPEIQWIAVNGYLFFSALPSPPTISHPTLKSEIRIPLSQHPRQTRRSHNQRRNKPPLELRTPKPQPLHNKMHQGNPKRPRGQVIGHGRRDVIGRIPADNRGEEGPGAESARGERVAGGSAVGGLAIVESGGVGFGGVGLEAVCG